MQQATSSDTIAAMVDLLRRRSVVVLAGAGCSTESGIPDYRGPRARKRDRSPIRYPEFVGSAENRKRYWARSTIGWPRFTAARPNPAHDALARLERAGLVRGIITQNVDGLHHAAGSRRVVELHGSLARVVCLECGATEDRHGLQRRLLGLNAGWRTRLEESRVETAPDGDADLPDWATASFTVPTCLACRGVLKPDVVFFAENVPSQRVEEAWRLFGEGDVLLVVGSSLAVYSGRRFTDRAGKVGMPVAVANVGPTRADDVAAVKVEERLGILLPRLADSLTSA